MKKKDLRKIKSLSTSEIRPSFELLEISIIVVEPQGPINIGMIARTMKNFGFQNLILFNPQCEIDSEARKFSMHGLDILKNARIVQTDTDPSLISLKRLFNEFHYVIGTSGKLTRFNNVKRITYYVDEIDLSILQDPEAKVALVFGREDKGLYNEELDLCDFIVKIPVVDTYPALNLSHAVAITLFSLFREVRTIERGDIVASSPTDREQLFKVLESTLELLEYTAEGKEKVIRALKNILGRSFSSLKEINLLISLFVSIRKRIEK
jgi:tRNA/rRNA methyltransferase